MFTILHSSHYFSCVLTSQHCFMHVTRTVRYTCFCLLFCILRLLTSWSMQVLLLLPAFFTFWNVTSKNCVGFVQCLVRNRTHFRSAQYWSLSDFFPLKVFIGVVLIMINHLHPYTCCHEEGLSRRERLVTNFKFSRLFAVPKIIWWMQGPLLTNCVKSRNVCLYLSIIPTFESARFGNRGSVS